MGNSVLVHLAKYPAEELDVRTLEILLGDADKSLVEDNNLLTLLLKHLPEDPFVAEIRGEEAALLEAVAKMSQAREKKLQTHRLAWNKAIEEGRVVRFVARGGAVTEEEYETPELARAAVEEFSNQISFRSVVLVEILLPVT